MTSGEGHSSLETSGEGADSPFPTGQPEGRGERGPFVPPREDRKVGKGQGDLEGQTEAIEHRAMSVCEWDSSPGSATSEKLLNTL